MFSYQDHTLSIKASQYIIHMNPNQLKQIIGTVIDGLEGKIKVLSNEIESIKETMPTIDNVLANVEIKTPKYGEDWSFSDDEMQEIMNEIRPQEGVDYFMPKDGKDAVVTDELIERIAGIVQSRVKNGKDGKDGRNGIDAITPEKGVDYFDGKDGENGSPDTPKEIVDKLNTVENAIDWKVLKDFDSLVNQDTLKRAVQTLENQTRYLLQKTGTSGGGGGTPSTPLNSVQYNLASAFAGDSNFTRVSATQETIMLKDMVATSVKTGITISEDLFGIASIPGAMIGLNNTSGTPAVYMTGVTTDLTNVLGVTAEGILSGGFDLTSGDNLLIIGTYLTPPTVATAGFYYNIANTSGNSFSELVLNTNRAALFFNDTTTTNEATIRADATGADLVFLDAAGTQDAQVTASDTFCRFRFTADGTNIYNAVLEDGVFAVRQINGFSNFLEIDMINDVYTMGDIDGVDNSTLLTVDDANSVIKINNRFSEDKGADVTAANNLTLGAGGNTFVITGNTQINAITTASWQAGSHITLIFTGTPTVKHNTAGGAGTAVLFLAGSVDLVAANNTVLCLVYDGTQWQETSRKVA